MRVRWMLLLAFVAMPALAAEIKVTVKQLPRRAWKESLTATKASFDRYLHVVADADIALDMSLVSPFVGDTSGALAAHALTPTTLALKRGVAQLVLVTVSRVERADVYRGTIAFRDKIPRDIMHVELALDVRVKPAFAAPPAQSIARVSHRDGNDWLARLLVGSESVDGKALLKVQSTTPQKVHIAAADVLATGVKSGREVGETLIDVKTITSSDVGIIRFPVTVDRANLAPDRYSGSVLISAGEAGDTYLTVPFDISIRAWVKAPRYNGQPAQVGPLANVLVGYAAGNPLMKKWTDAALEKISAIAGVKATIPMLHSTLGRHGARAVRTAVLSELATKHWQLLTDNVLKGDTAIYNKPVFPKGEISGVGFHEAPRGTLSHWVVIDNGVIKNYQAVVPTTWNASPRDEKGISGPYEAALLRNPIADPEHPLEVLRTIHSFDPCIACAVHTFDPAGNNIARVKVL